MKPNSFVVNITPCSMAETETLIQRFQEATGLRVSNHANANPSETWDKRPMVILHGEFDLPFKVPSDFDDAEEALTSFENELWSKIDKTFPSRQIDGELWLDLPDPPPTEMSKLHDMKIFHPGNRTVH